MPTFDLGKIIGPQGPQGAQGVQGKQGVQGVQGVPGRDGYTPNIQVGQTITLSAGSDATVTRRAGSPDSAPVFDFGIPKGADAINAGDMYKSIYDPQNKAQDIFGYVDNEISKSGVTFTLTCNKSGTVFSLTGSNLPSTGFVPCIFKAAADFEEGNTFTVNNSAYTIATSNGEALSYKAFVKNSIVPIVLDRSGKTINFKQAGGALSLSATSYIMVQCFTENGTFTAPMTGKYRITCIGKGGRGAHGTKVGTGDYELLGINGAGGGAGGAGQITVQLEKGDVKQVTANGTASFGTLITATAGEDGKIVKNGLSSSTTPGAPGSCSGTGVTVFTPNAATAGKNTPVSEYGYAEGGNGGFYDDSDCIFLSSEGGKGGDITNQIDGIPPAKPSPSGGFPFGVGGGGGGYRCYSIPFSVTGIAPVPYYGTGAEGGPAAVIVELLTN